jgi:molybdopterin molybdotransferase
MLSFDEARRVILAQARLLPVETAPLHDADGRVLRAPLVARAPIPPFSLSAMDGYAFAAESAHGEGPWELEVVGESRTGRPSSGLAPGAAQAISTGAELPEGADTVIPREQTERTERGIRFSDRARSGQHVRRRGEDLEAGAEALTAGTRLGAAALGLAASLDRTDLVVSRRPRVRILCTGDELRAPGSADVPGTIPESISVGLRAMAMRACAVVDVAPYVSDERETTEAAVGAALEGVDLLLTVGGVSVGHHDWVRPALDAHGVRLEFWKVAIKPGKPVALGRAGDEGPLVLCLPGNPASALITFGLFGLPLLRAMQGDDSPIPHTQRLTLASSLSHKPGRLEFVRARLTRAGDEIRVAPLSNQASGALTSLAWGDALAMLPAEVTHLDAGQPIETLRWQDL